MAEDFICTNCEKLTSWMEEFPGEICLECYKLTPAAYAPITAEELARMWGGK